MSINIDKTKPFTVWFTGLSASGKTTQSEMLYDSLKKLGFSNVILLDGESIRDKFKMYKFDSISREQIGIQKAQIALDLNKEGKIVLISGIAHKKKGRDDIRNMINNYFEVFLDCSVDCCAERDFKGNYKKAISGNLDNFIGISEPYEASDRHDLLVDTGSNNIESCSNKILKSVLAFIKKN